MRSYPRPVPAPRWFPLFAGFVVVLAIAGVCAEIYAWHTIATVGVEHAPWWVLFLAFGGR